MTGSDHPRFAVDGQRRTALDVARRFRAKRVQRWLARKMQVVEGSVPRAALYDMKGGNGGHGSWSRWQKALYDLEAPLTAAAFRQGRHAYRGPHALLAELRLDKMDATALRARAEAAGVAEDSVEEAAGKPEPLHALRMLNLQVEEGRRRLAAGIGGAVMKEDIARAEELLGAAKDAAVVANKKQFAELEGGVQYEPEQGKAPQLGYRALGSARVGLGRVVACTTGEMSAHPLHTRIAHIFGASISDTTMRPNPRRAASR